MIPGHKNRFILWNLQKPVFPTFKNGAFVCNIAVAQLKNLCIYQVVYQY